MIGYGKLRPELVRSRTQLGALQLRGCHPRLSRGDMPNGILIVDDNPSVRSLIRAQLAVSGLTVCGEAVDGLDAIEKTSIFES